MGCSFCVDFFETSKITILSNGKKYGNILMLLVWRNGRRSRLKICRGQLRMGSSPITSIGGIIHKE